MTSSLIRSFLVLSAFGLAADSAGAQIRCWNDDDGIRHCGDSVPPDQARHDREILNEQGITIRTEQGEITPEEQAEIDRIAAEEAEKERLRQEQLEYDQMLLDAFLSVEDIENLRDRRLELMDSQIRIIEIYLGNLYAKLEGLKRDTQRFAPLSDRENAPPIPQNLVLDIDRTESSIEVREQALQSIRQTQEEIRTDFQRDIERFQQLKPGV